MRRRLGRSVHGDGKVLLAHGLGELEVVGSDIGHLALHLEVAEMLLRLDHAHVDILLVCCGDLLLLLLKDLDLLCNGKLLHCASYVSRRFPGIRRVLRTHEGSQLRRTPTVRNVQTTACRAHGTLLTLLLIHREVGDAVG